MKATITARGVGVICALALALAVSPARGVEVKVFTSNTSSQTFSDGASHFLNLTGTSGNDSIVVQSPNLGEDTLIIMWFAAECAVAASDTRTWLDIDIFVNGVALPPTDGDNAFCTSRGPPGQTLVPRPAVPASDRARVTESHPRLAESQLDSWVSAATHGAFLDVVHTIGASSYTVQVRATLRGFNQGERGWIDDLSLIIFVE